MSPEYHNEAPNTSRQKDSELPLAFTKRATDTTQFSTLMLKALTEGLHEESSSEPFIHRQKPDSEVNKRKNAVLSSVVRTYEGTSSDEIKKKYITLSDIRKSKPSTLRGRLLSTRGVVISKKHTSFDDGRITRIEICEFPDTTKVNMFVVSNTKCYSLERDLKFGYEYIIEGMTAVYPLHSVSRQPVFIIPSIENMRLVRFIDRCKICNYSEVCGNVVDLSKGKICTDHISKELQKKNLNRPEITSITAWKTKADLEMIQPGTSSSARVGKRLESTYNINNKYLVTISPLGTVKFTSMDKRARSLASKRNRRLGEKIASSSYSLGAKHLAKALNLSEKNKDQVLDVFSENATRKIGFNPSTNSRYIEPEFKDTPQTCGKSAGFVKIPLSGLGARDIIELTDEED